MTLFSLLSLTMAAVTLWLGWLFSSAVCRFPSLPQCLPRHRPAGILLGVLVLCWCAHDGAALLPAKYAAWCWGAVPVCAALAVFYLDFLFARSLGGLLIVLPNYLIQHAFAYDCGARPLYAIVCLLFGVAGMVLVAWPWKLREWLCAAQKAASSSSRRRRLRCCTLFLALLLAILPFI